MTKNIQLWAVAIVAFGLVLSGCAGPQETATASTGVFELKGDIDMVLRLYVPNLEKFKSWTPPTAKKLAVQ